MSKSVTLPKRLANDTIDLAATLGDQLSTHAIARDFDHLHALTCAGKALLDTMQHEIIVGVFIPAVILEHAAFTLDTNYFNFHFLVLSV